MSSVSIIVACFLGVFCYHTTSIHYHAAGHIKETATLITTSTLTENVSNMYVCAGVGVRGGCLRGV